MQSEKSTSSTREHILEVARREFASKGYAGASINAIVDAMSVSKPTVYYHFKNKAALFATLVEDAFGRYIENRERAIATSSSTIEQIHLAVAADFAFCVSHPELVRFSLALIFGLPMEQPVDVTPVLERDYEVYRRLVERGVASGELKALDPRDAAMALQGSVAINVMSFLKMGQTVDFLASSRARAVVEVLLKEWRSSSNPPDGVANG